MAAREKQVLLLQYHILIVKEKAATSVEIEKILRSDVAYLIRLL